MLILNAQQLKAADKFTCEKQNISSNQLMERAAIAFTKKFVTDFPNKKVVYIFCGNGNNGGDGLAIARLLSDKNYDVVVYVVNHSDKFSADFLLNLEKTREENIDYNEINKAEEFPYNIDQQTIVIDALLGIGLNKNLDNILQSVVNQINKIKNIVVSVDVPTGLSLETTMESEVIFADKVYTFHSTKLAMLLPQNSKYIKDFTVLDIGLDISFLKAYEKNLALVDQKSVKNLIKKRNTFDHKGSFGHCFVVAGKVGSIGAALLCAKACLKVGAGLVTAQVPAKANNVFQSSFWEAMVVTDSNEKIITETKDISKYTALAIGPGLGTDEATAQVVEDYLKVEIPTVVDADALNIIAQNKKMALLSNKIITPHFKEFERLFGKPESDFDRIEKAKENAIELNCVIVLKGAYTCIVLPTGKIYFNKTGNNGLATAGSGDVLTGLITGLLAQGYSKENAAIVGVYLHGKAADAQIEITGQHGLLASDIFNGLAVAFRSIV